LNWKIELYLELNPGIQELNVEFTVPHTVSKTWFNRMVIDFHFDREGKPMMTDHFLELMAPIRNKA
jgi:ribosome biogenesis SPOUT family RNA methylase Rps3